MTKGIFAYNSSESGWKCHTCGKLQLFTPLPHCSTGLPSAEGSPVGLILGEKSPSPPCLGRKLEALAWKSSQRKQCLRFSDFETLLFYLSLMGGFRTGEEVSKDWWTLRFGSGFDSTFPCCLFMPITAPRKGLHWWDPLHPLYSAASLRAPPALGNRLFLTKASKSSLLWLQRNDNLPFRDPFCGWLS